MLKKKENIQNYLSTLNSQNVFLTKSPCEKWTGNSFLEQLFQLYFSQVGPQQKITCQCEVGDKTAVLGGQCGWATLPTTSKQSKIQKQKSTTWWEDDALWLNNAQAFPSNTVACLCAPKKKNDPVVTAFNFSSVNTTEHADRSVQKKWFHVLILHLTTLTRSQHMYIDNLFQS